MPWQCSCSVINVNLNSHCAVCKIVKRPSEYDFIPDSFDALIYKVVLSSLDEIARFQGVSRISEITRGEIIMMTPEEELFAKFFRNEAERVISLDDIDLRLRREELIEIAKEARARLTAVREQERDREAKSKKTSGFSRSIDADEIASEAINKINARKKNLSKMDKIIEGLLKIPGMDRKTAEGIASARNLKDFQESKAAKSDGYDSESLKTPKVVSSEGFNPFESKSSETKTEVTMIAETNTVIITKTEEINPEVKPFNPFGKK